MKKATRFAALFLVVAMALCMFAACTDGNGTQSDPKSNPDEQTVSEESKAPQLFEGLPEKNYNNEEFIILVPGDEFGSYASFEVEEMDTYTLTMNDALKQRNELVGEKFGVTIKSLRTQSGQNMLDLIRNESIAFTGDFDVATPYIPNAASLAAEGALYNFNELKYIDLSKPCWDQNAVDSLSICGQTYFATGDLNLLTLACTHAIVFNKDLVKEFNLDDPYKLVNDGDWTIDKLREMGAAVHNLTQDGKEGMSVEDRFGFLVNSNYVTSMYIGAGKKLVEKDNDDVPYIALVNEASTAATIFSKIFDLVNDPNVTGKIDDTNSDYYKSAVASGTNCWDAATASVANKLALFRSMSVIDIIDLGEYYCNFGVLPTPKFDKAQDGYHSFVSTILSTAFVVPSGYPDTDKASIIIQALTEASTKTTKHAYYDTILKGRKIQDYDSEDMLDIIFNSRVYDLGVIYNWGGTSTWDTNSIGLFMNDVAFSGGTTMTFASKLDSIKDKIQTDLEDDIEWFLDQAAK